MSTVQIPKIFKFLAEKKENQKIVTVEKVEWKTAEIMQIHFPSIN